MNPTHTSHSATLASPRDPGPVVLITGALAGIGRATALAFAREGARLIVSGRHEPAGHALVDTLRAEGAQAEFVRADVRIESDVAHLVQSAMDRYGRLDVAVNNAGIEGTTGPVTEFTQDNYQAIFDTNVLGVLLSMKHEMRAMAPQGAGVIVNLASVAGQVGLAGAAVYAASKHAVEALTRSVAMEGAPVGVRVNAVAPGPVQTGMFDRFTSGSREAQAAMAAAVPLRRVATPDEIAQSIVFLAGDRSGFITGAVLTVDGGFTVQ
jgi:NAD(P)-dependent dehydrogenase (short-subunit alcohol dehydrogenase family)